MQLDVTKEIARLQELAKAMDYEIPHGEADDILCDVLRQLGYGDLVDAYDKVGKWYA